MLSDLMYKNNTIIHVYFVTGKHHETSETEIMTRSILYFNDLYYSIDVST